MSQFSTTDPTWDQLTNGLPYLDAVVHETLRLHPALGSTNRVASTLRIPFTSRNLISIILKATSDDVVPLSKPIETLSGEVTDRIFVAKGTAVVVPIHALNKSTKLWGEDAQSFIPERWFDEEGLAGAKDIQGYRHMLTFVDGTRKCLGQGFALAEFKVNACHGFGRPYCSLILLLTVGVVCLDPQLYVRVPGWTRHENWITGFDTLKTRCRRTRGCQSPLESASCRSPCLTVAWNGLIFRYVGAFCSATIVKQCISFSSRDLSNYASGFLSVSLTPYLAGSVP